VLLGLNGDFAALANFPYDADKVESQVNNTTNNRTVSNGFAFVALLANFTGQPAGTYDTNTLNFEMVNNI